MEFAINPKVTFGFDQLCSLQLETKQDFDPEYLGLKHELVEAYRSIESMEIELSKAIISYNFLQTHKVDKALGVYLCNTFGLESITGLPRELHYLGSQTACTEICLEGLGSFIVETVKKIAQFFINMFNTIMRFFGLKSARQKAVEHELDKVERKINGLDTREFSSLIKKNVKCSVDTMQIKELDRVTSDLLNMYDLITSHKDETDIKSLVSSTSGILTTLGYGVKDEYKIVALPTGLPYTELKANTTLNIENELGIRNIEDVFNSINNVKKIIRISIDLQKWYPANLKKYAQRASSIKVDPNDPSTQKTQIENVKQLNEEQKCQAYICKMIVLFLDLSDLLCARTVATLKSLL